MEVIQVLKGMKKSMAIVVVSYFVLFFLCYLAAFVPMLIEGIGLIFGASLLGQTLIDKIHQYDSYVLFSMLISILLLALVLGSIHSHKEGLDE